MTSKRNEKCYVLLSLVTAVVLTLAVDTMAEWTLDESTNTFILDPGLCTAEVFEHQWYLDETADPAAYLYDHNMLYRGDTWYTGAIKPNMVSYHDPDVGDEGYDPCNVPFDPNYPHYADIRFQSANAGADIMELETTIWHNCHNYQMTADHYMAYSVDSGQSYTNYFLNENWDRGSNPPGSGFGNELLADAASVEIGSTANEILVRYGINELLYEDFTDGTDYEWHSWDEWYGLAWKIRAKSNDTEFHDNYTASPFDQSDGSSSTIYDSTLVGWYSGLSGCLVNNYSPLPCNCVYMVASRNPILGIDVRLTSTDRPATAEAINCGSVDTHLNVAISMSPDGPWMTLYTSTGLEVTNEQNPGFYFDLSAAMPDVVYVNIYSTDDNDPGRTGGQHYIRWGGFHVELDTIPYDCAAVRDLGLGYGGDADADCDVDMLDLSQLASDWLLCNDPEGDPSHCQAPQQQ